jgi:hypothetical protein
MDAEIMRRKVRAATAADVRKYFVTPGGMKVPKDAAAEAAMTVSVYPDNQPALTTLRITAHRNTTEDYETKTKGEWQILQDICDAKFTRVGLKGVYPAKDGFSEEVTKILTDTWEAEGVRIELYVQEGSHTAPGTVISTGKGQNPLLIAHPVGATVAK